MWLEQHEIFGFCLHLYRDQHIIDLFPCRLRNGVKYCKVLRLPEVWVFFPLIFCFWLTICSWSIKLFPSKFVVQILCIHLKRFRHEVMYSFKISSHVSFPLEGLDMRPFLAKESPSQITTYDLLSVICHHGTAGSMSSLDFFLCA